MLRLLAALLVLPVCAVAKRFEFSTYAGRPTEWFGSAEARAIAGNLLLFQHKSGGWPKNRDMRLTPAQEAAQRAIPDDETRPNFDNGATHSQLQFLARVIAAGGDEDGRLRHSFLRGLDYCLAAQYANGGWPQYFPLVRGYYTHITFNDGAMVGVLEVLEGVARGRPPFDFVDEPRRERSRTAVARGVECILACQIVQDGRRTIWAAQHDEYTLAPAGARTFEPAALCAGESAGVLRFLMRIEEPSAAVVEAIEAGVAWLQAHAIRGLRCDLVPAPGAARGVDRVVVPDPAAPPLWARFYELGTNRPIFVGRDGVVRYAMHEIEQERRAGYAWYVDWPASVLKKDYPAWKRRLGAFTVSNTERKLRPHFPWIRRPDVVAGEEVLRREDLIYVRRGSEELALDVYRLHDGVVRPAVLIVHGGGWESGARQMERPLALALAQRGYVAVPVSYRLGPSGRFPAALHDLKRAVVWLRVRAAEFGLDPRRIAMVGASAGGQLAALVGATNTLEEFNDPLFPASASVVQAVVNIDGLADFTAADLVAQQEQSPSAPVRFLGGKFSFAPDVWRAASPLTHVGPHSAPTLFLNSTAPTPLLPGRGEMRELLLAAGVASELVVLPDTPHPFWLFEPWFSRVVDEIDRFLSVQLEGRPR